MKTINKKFPYFYEVLQVALTATPEEIKQAYRRRCKETHPDATQESSDEFREVQEAYEALSDEEKRKVYDAGGDWNGKYTDQATRLVLGMALNAIHNSGLFTPAAARIHALAIIEVKAQIEQARSERIKLLDNSKSLLKMAESYSERSPFRATLVKKAAEMENQSAAISDEMAQEVLKILEQGKPTDPAQTETNGFLTASYTYKYLDF